MPKQVFTALDMVAASRQRSPDKIALKDKSQSLTYDALWTGIETIGRALRDRGIGKGDIVGIFQGISVDTVVTMFGVLRSGASFVCIHPQLKPLQVEHISGDTGMRVVVTDRPDYFDDVPVPLERTNTAALLAEGEVSTAALPRVIDRDLANLIFTSGSTGKPKGVMFSHAEIVMCARIMAELFDNVPEDNLLCVLPFSADYGLTLLYTMMLVGGRLTIVDSFLPNDIVKGLSEEQCTGFGAVREMWPLLFGPRSRFPDTDFPALRYVSCGGGVPPRGVIQGMIDKFDGTSKIYMLYGLTEASWSTCLPPERIKEKVVSIGPPLPNVEIFIVDEDGKPVPQGEEGELVHRGGVVAKGYWNEQEKTAKMFRRAGVVPDYLRDTERVCYSGDIVLADEEGYIYYKGRKDDQIKVRGYRVSTQDVVDAMYRSGEIADGWIFGVPDDVTGERIVACIVAKEPGDGVKQRLIDALKKDLPLYSIPAEVLCFESLPLTHSMKYDVSLLSRLYKENNLIDGYSFADSSAGSAT